MCPLVCQISVSASSTRLIRRATLTLLLMSSAVSCEKEAAVVVGCASQVPGNRMFVKVFRDGGQELGTAEFAPNEVELGALLKVDPSGKTDERGSLRKVYVFKAVPPAVPREVPVGNLALIAQFNLRANSDLERSATREGMDLSKWITDRTSIDADDAAIQTLDGLDALIGTDTRALNLVRTDKTEGMFVVVSGVIYAAEVNMSFNLGNGNPFDTRYFTVGRTNVHVGFNCTPLDRLRRLSSKRADKRIPVLVQYSRVVYSQDRDHLTLSKVPSDGYQ